MIDWAEVDAETVPPDIRRMANLVLADARRDLDLPPIAVRWFDVATDGAPVAFRTPPGRGLDGQCRTRRRRDTDEWVATTIWLRRGDGHELPRPPLVAHIEPLTPDDVARTVRHEARHARDQVDGVASDEATADAYADRFADIVDDGLYSDLIDDGALLPPRPSAASKPRPPRGERIAGFHFRD